jgi:hypothetical protein
MSFSGCTYPYPESTLPPMASRCEGVSLAGWSLQNWLNSLNQLLFAIDK